MDNKRQRRWLSKEEKKGRTFAQRGTVVDVFASSNERASLTAESRMPCNSISGS
jgi:hypothetical protein